MIRTSKTCAGKHYCAILLLLLSLCTEAAATNLTGAFKNPDSSPVSGKIIFLLSQPARLSDQSAQIVPMVKIFSVTNGALESGAFVYGNDVLVPGGTYYLVRLVDANNNLLFEQKWSISGVDLNLGTLTPTTTGVVFPDPLIKNLSSGQAVQGPVSFSSPITAFSLTLNGNLNPGAADLYELGNSSAPWRELHAQRWNSLFAVGSSSGTVTPPAVAPGTSSVLSGGSIADGTYYCKFVYVNRNGETSGSPTATITVSGGGGAATVFVGDAGGNDDGWLTGAYGYRIYCSTTAGGTFYRQTPAPVAADFMTDATTHLVRMGDAGSRFTSFTFSGTTLPVSNTATIDALQVALNATRRNLPAFPTNKEPFGTLFIPAVDGQVNPSGQFNLTTPLILGPDDHIIGSGGMNTSVDSQTRIFSTWAANPQLATVMNFGGGATIEHVGIQSTTGHVYMILGGAGLSAGHGTRLSDSFLRTDDNSNTYAALVVLGIIYDIHVDYVSMRCGKACIQYRNAAGGLHYYSNMRLDLGGNSAVQSIPGWTDPDSGTHDGAFPFGVGGIVIEKVRTELGTGIIWDMVGLGVEFGRVETADLAAGSRDSLAKFGSDATYGGQAGPLIMRNSSFGTASNARVGTNWVGTYGAIYLHGASNLGFGTSTGSYLTLDMNNIGLEVHDFSGGGSYDPAAAATTPHAINVPDAALIYAFGDTGGGANVKPWNEIYGARLVFTPKNGSNPRRQDRWSLVNDATAGSNFQLRRGSDDAYLLDVAQSTGFTNIRGNARIQATGGIAATLFIGPSNLTASGGNIAMPFQGSVQTRNGNNTADLLLIRSNSPGAGVNIVEVGTSTSVDGGVKIGPNTNTAAIKGILTATATLDFPNTAISACSDLTMTVTGAGTSDMVSIGTPNSSVPVGGSFFAWVSATDTVTVRFCADGTARDPASGSFRATVVKF